MDCGRSLLYRFACAARPRAGCGAPDQRGSRTATTQRFAKPGQAAAAVGTNSRGANHSGDWHAGRLQYYLAGAGVTQQRPFDYAGG
ncbi:MAG: hypothetical protein V7K25_16480 [Nostoc sp.]|uniref:hypothetical protein n=1 Tax=Nostoc sp. TaxID=1180 RepID=UPI002FF7FF3D